MHDGRVVDPATAKRLDEALVGAEHGGDGRELVPVHGRLDALGKVGARDEAIVVQRHDGFDASPPAVVEQHEERLPRQCRATGLPGEVVGLVGLTRLDGDDHDPVGQPGRVPGDRDRAGDLGGVERVERVAVTHRRGHRSSAPSTGRAPA